MVKKNNKNIDIQLFEIINNKLFTSEFISGIAGDTHLSNGDKNVYDKLLNEIGDDLYVKILKENKISIYSISTYNTDYILIKEKDKNNAASCLSKYFEIL